ncbi:MAG: protein-L-isoaspartate(D-aspartate) O-methyltransferase [Nitrospirae bacterium]|nr:protein-L-isoaspartate(D-aspartate) O-methyltransferase [Nitrospirota bacterium]
MDRLRIIPIVVLPLFFLVSNSAADEYSISRREMVEAQLAGRGIKDKRVLDAMSKIPRHHFVASPFRNSAYDDHPLPIGEGQTISQPYVVALMTEALKLKSSDRVLEIGTGSGYQAAVLAEMVKEVYTIEIIELLQKKASKLLTDLGYKHIRTKHADGYFGWEEYAPFDAIIITASANHIPPLLIEQLKDGGRLIIPLGSTLYYQTLTLVSKIKGELEVEQMGGVAFVPMTGEAGKRK